MTNSDAKHLNAAFVTLLSRHEPVVRAYLRTLVSTPAEVDELMPEVALLAWQKFSTLAEQRAFPQWACIIARYEVLRRRRDKAHDRLVLDDDVIAKLADEAETARDERQRQMAALERRERPKSSRRRGRTPDNAAPDGRAYNNRGYTMWRQAAE